MQILGKVRSVCQKPCLYFSHRDPEKQIRVPGFREPIADKFSGTGAKVEIR
jgi:hypothetical protein